MIQLGNTNYSTILFNITDDINPKINITFPLQNNTNHSDNTIDINYTRSDINLQSCYYSNDTYEAEYYPG